ncbi:lysine exporter LysO family protein [bacterium]|nr:lysine exporter LysO family protein [bacterium]
MANSLKLLLIFLGGIALGLLKFIPASVDIDKISEYLLYLLVFGIGITISRSEGILKIVKTYHLKLFLLPLLIAIGSLLGALLLGFFYSDITIKHSLGLGAGLGYYSLSSLMISQYGFKEIGAIALISNIIREISTLILAPLMIKYLGRFSPIASAGATSMDTTLAVIIKYTDKENAIISMFNGVTLSIMVPLLITLIYEFA